MTSGERPDHIRDAMILATAACMALCAGIPTHATEEALAPAEIVGTTTSEQILKISPEWQANHDACDPYPKSITAIRDAAAAAPGEITIEVIFGSWCSDSRDQIPRLIKILEQVGADRIPTSYTGVPKARERRGERIAQLKLTAIPTILVSRKGTEIGRIVETPQVSIEEDLAAILKPR